MKCLVSGIISPKRGCELKKILLVKSSDHARVQVKIPIMPDSCINKIYWRKYYIILYFNNPKNFIKLNFHNVFQ